MWNLAQADKKNLLRPKQLSKPFSDHLQRKICHTACHWKLASATASCPTGGLVAASLLLQESGKNLAGRRKTPTGTKIFVCPRKPDNEPVVERSADRFFWQKTEATRLYSQKRSVNWVRPNAFCRGWLHCE